MLLLYRKIIKIRSFCKFIGAEKGVSTIDKGLVSFNERSEQREKNKGRLKLQTGNERSLSLTGVQGIVGVHLGVDLNAPGGYRAVFVYNSLLYEQNCTKFVLNWNIQRSKHQWVSKR